MFEKDSLGSWTTIAGGSIRAAEKNVAWIRHQHAKWCKYLIIWVMMIENNRNINTLLIKYLIIWVMMIEIIGILIH